MECVYCKVYIRWYAVWQLNMHWVKLNKGLSSGYKAVLFYTIYKYFVCAYENRIEYWCSEVYSQVNIFHSLIDSGMVEQARVIQLRKVSWVYNGDEKNFSTLFKVARDFVKIDKMSFYLESRMYVTALTSFDIRFNTYLTKARTTKNTHNYIKSWHKINS